ncbi:scavenger receptor cysteine-rich type 1 protein M130-like isoform X2 [Scleropages formosus]|nr:scavenger receptor cysteine-rich type 1 protein M130-like isoform X2 [Scleropages formosus]
MVRLVNGHGNCSGRVEVFYKGHWGTVCDDNWDMLNGHVVCKELGCGKAVETPRRAHFGKGSGLIWHDRWLCKGNETSLASCKSKAGRLDCSHAHDASVKCFKDEGQGSLKVPRWAVALVVMVALLAAVLFGISWFLCRRFGLQKLETAHRVCESNIYTVI